MLIDCAVVGAGPAGLATSAALSARGVEHVVLERGRVGESWRTQRWESFRLNTPGWMNQLLGEQARDTYATGVEVVQRLEKLQQADQATPLASLAACPSGCQGRWAGRPSCSPAGRRRWIDRYASGPSTASTALTVPLGREATIIGASW